MHILFLTENFPPETNAAATRIYERALFWIRWGHQVTVVTSAPNFPAGRVFDGYQNAWHQEENMDGIRVIRVKTYIAANEGFFRRILDFLSFMVTGSIAALMCRRVDVVVANSPQFFTAVGGWVVAALKRRPFVFELADLWPKSILAVGAMKRGMAIRAIEKLELFLYHRAKAIIALTEAFKRDLTSRGICEAKIHAVLNGVDLSRYKPQPKDRVLLSEWSLKDKFVVGYVGTHGMAHDLGKVLDAAALNDNKSNLVFLLVGAGAEREALKARAAHEKLSSVIFGEPQPKAAMPKVWSVCDVALVHLKDDPTFSEVIPSKIFEAMGMGLPVLLVAPEGEASKIVTTEETGLWVEAGDPKELLNAAYRLMTGKHERQIYVQNSIEHASSHTREHQAQQMLAVLEGVIG